jgi:hypothetical protein
MSGIVWWPVLQPLLEVDATLDQLVHRPSVGQFPDGSASFSLTVDILDCWQLLKGYRNSGFQVRQNTMWRSLRSFPYREYQIVTTWKYFDQIGGEEDLLVTPVPWNDDVFAHEFNIEEFPVQVNFWKRTAKPIMEKLREALDYWADSVKYRGIFSDGPACWHPESWHIKGKRCEFTIDIARSGQDTLNWLILCILNFGAAQSPISEIRFTHFLPLPEPSPTERMINDELAKLYRWSQRKGLDSAVQLEVLTKLGKLTQRKNVDPHELLRNLREIRELYGP